MNWRTRRFVVGDLHGVAALDAAMHRKFEVEPVRRAQARRLLDVMGEALLAAVEVDGGDALAGFQQRNRDMQGGGGFARTALLVAEHDDMRRWCRPWARCTKAISLVRLARRACRSRGRVDLRQPGAVRADEDFSSYPPFDWRTIAALLEEKVDLVWAPNVSVMYPEGFATRIVPEGPATAGLEDAFRPHFFAGVATVVAKLFTQARRPRGVRREGLPAAQGGHPHGARSRPAGQGHRRADGARKGRPRDVVAQRPDAESSAARLAPCR
jgi:hypothetical protein